jgi:hypothetical protein
VTGWSDFIIVKDNTFVAAPCRSSWGILVPNMEIFRECCRSNISGFISVRAGEYDLDREKHVHPAPRLRLCSVVPHETDPKKLKHNKPIWYYPPVVNHIGEFEATARGYLPREDKLDPTRTYQSALDKQERALQRC